MNHITSQSNKKVSVQRFWERVHCVIMQHGIRVCNLQRPTKCLAMCAAS